MALSTYLKAFNLSVNGGDILGSDHLEYVMPHHNGVIHTAEFWAFQQEDSTGGSLYDVMLLHGVRGKSLSGLLNSEFVRENIGFYSLVQLFETIRNGFRDPDTGRVLIPGKPLVKNADEAVWTDDGIGMYLTDGSQKHYTRSRDYDVYKVREQRRLAGTSHHRDIRR